MLPSPIVQPPSLQHLYDLLTYVSFSSWVFPSVALDDPVAQLLLLCLSEDLEALTLLSQGN